MSDEAEFWKNFLSLMRGIHQDQVIANAEVTLASMPAETPIPMPDTAHPSLTHCQDFVRDFNKDYVQVTSINNRNLRAYDKELYPSQTLTTRKTLLTRQKCWGPAPFTGDPRHDMAIYVWSVWSDDMGRHVASSAELIWR